MYIYFDESGDLGNNTQDAYFVLAGIATQNPKKLAKTVIRLRETLKAKSQKQEKELKYSKASDIVKRRVLESISEIEDVVIYAIVVDKRTVFPNLMNKKEIYFNWIVRLLADKLLVRNSDNKEEISFFIDKRSYGKARTEFDKYLTSNNFFAKLGISFRINIFHVVSEDEKCIQLADFVAGAIHQKYSRSKPEFFQIIQKKTNVLELHNPIKRN